MNLTKSLATCVLHGGEVTFYRQDPPYVRTATLVMRVKTVINNEHGLESALTLSEISAADHDIVGEAIDELIMKFMEALSDLEFENTEEKDG